MALELRLPSLQRWMQAVVVHPGSCDEALRSPEAEAELAAGRVGELILASRTLAPAERVDIYHGMYLIRMEEALAFDYPALKHFLGDEVFLRLVEGYVQVHPSRSYTLNRLGDRLPEYVKTAAGIPRPQFCHDLARLELAFSQVFDAPETPPLSEAAIAQVPEGAWERAMLRPIEAFRLLAFRYPVNAYLDSVREERHGSHPKPRLAATWVAMYRRNYAVYRLEIAKPAHDLLSDLVAGMPLGKAVESAIRRGGRRAPQPAQLSAWFKEWVSGGVFRSVEPGA